MASHEIVVLGASAGGIEAVRELVRALPAIPLGDPATLQEHESQ